MAFNATSDRRLKKDIKECDLGLDFINRLKPVEFKYNIETDEDTHHGFIAQDIQDLNCFNGAINTNCDDYLALNYSEFIAPITKAIQELYNMNNDLSNEVANLQKINNEIQELLQKL